MVTKWFSLAEPTDGMPQPFVTVDALHEGKWTRAIWTGTTWFAEGRRLSVTQWALSQPESRDDLATAA